MALSTSRTVITKSGLTTTQTFDVGGIQAGVSNLHTIGYDVVDTNTGTGVTVRSTGNAVFSGVITATKFVGDISEATGAAAGLGTALSQTQTDPLNKVYFTDKVLSISTTTTIDHPATVNLAYTQYGDIKIEDGHDLIIKDGDDFKYDILGISTTKLANNEFPNGLSGNLTGDVTGNVNNSTLLLKTGGNERLRITSTGDIGLGCIPDSNVRLHIEKAGEANMILEGDVNGIGGYLMLKNNNTTANASMAIQFLDGGGQGTSEIKGINADNSLNEGHLAFSTRPSGGSMTERLRIDSSGNVTKPTSFHILVRRSGNQTGYSATFPGDNITWNNVVTAQSSTNASNHFNTSTGIFTAPITGLYFFHAAVNCNFNVQGAWLVVNGSRANYSAFNPNSANTSDGTVTYKLTTGDEVALKWYENGGSNRTINANDLHTWWRIILLG